MSRRVPTPAGFEALDEARLTTDLLRDGRDTVHRLAERRRRAVLRANHEGCSYGRIAGELGVSRANVQQLINQARAREEAS